MTVASPSLEVIGAGAAAGVGMYLVVSATMFGRRGLGVSQRIAGVAATWRRWRHQAGLADAPGWVVFAAPAVVAALGAAGAHAIYGGWPATLLVGVAVAGAPLHVARSRRRTRLERARDAWPRLLEELRLRVVSVGDSIPQALFAAGAHAPGQMRPAFDDARREWAMSTDLERTLRVLRQRLADPTADIVGETLLVAHQIGGTDVDARLRALIDDRSLDVQSRRDARARQAGARFSRLFVLVVPIAMALIGLAIGEGRSAFATASGQVAVVAGLALMAGCWWWAGRLLRLPDEPRVFAATDGGT